MSRQTVGHASVGGTFADVAVSGGSRPAAVKAPATPDGLAAGVMEGVRSAAAGIGLSESREIVHGSTAGTDALHSGAARAGKLAGSS